ncbi:MAG: DHA2 family efflux MFS transporter permease subunit [Syntrophobacteraceae bacterium]|nr:DHA2 family efflux MFS transporter permease subunit [Syntrophobacteraceae bacterium]
MDRGFVQIITKAMTAQTEDRPAVNKWVVALVVMLPTFIEVMDTSVVNVSLPHIQGSMSAGLDEVTWVLTSYLVANAIIIPITGWLAGLFGRKRYLIFSILIFTAASILCGAAPSLEVLILARILQGLGGGGLQPLSQAILFETFPRREHGMAMAVFGMGVVMAPIVGPVLGGWITDHWSWRWVFYINIPAGILAVVMTVLFISDPAYIKRQIFSIDKWGLFFLALGLGALQIVLDRGERLDWLQSNFIIILSVVAIVALVSFIVTELRAEHPVVDLRVFKDSTFTAGTTIMFLGFFCLFGSFVLLPLYAQELMGYTALWAGLILGPGGISSFIVMPISGILMKKGVKPWIILLAGLATTTCALLMMSGYDLQADFYSIALPRLIQGIGLGGFFVPLAAAAYVNIPVEQMGNASGVFNLLRNLGGSFGVAVTSTILSQRAQVHQTFLSESITPYNPAFRNAYQHAAGFMRMNHMAAPSKGGLAFVYGEVLRQASMLSFNDTFYVLAIGTALMTPLTLFLRKSSSRAGSSAAGMH